ncbi:hypothetical protein GOBAR_AA18775 [Gossypium barbadense]|uniref:Uncharacterized protein n=1 Tax=Gossypium barbadense TaxID=3634 RepID=A0A2P5XEZ5_GOSBA|nr:hypothetical protein GOBAR_AA18775 [Gossypium barbadense]
MTTETMRYYHEENKDVHDERRLRIEELDECKNKPDTSANQLQVGDTVLLDVVDPQIVTTTPIKEIPLTVLSIFPFGTVEVSHPKFGTFKWPNRERDTAVQYSRVEAGHDFPKTRGAINRHGRATWPWVKLIGTHGRENENPRAYQG